MTLLILGLILLLGVHSLRIVADDWRTATRARLGAGLWRGLYSLLALAGLVLVIVGYGEARQAPVMLWAPQPWMQTWYCSAAFWCGASWPIGPPVGATGPAVRPLRPPRRGVRSPQWPWPLSCGPSS